MGATTERKKKKHQQSSSQTVRTRIRKLLLSQLLDIQEADAWILDPWIWWQLLPSRQLPFGTHHLAFQWEHPKTKRKWLLFSFCLPSLTCIHLSGKTDLHPELELQGSLRNLYLFSFQALKEGGMEVTQWKCQPISKKRKMRLDQEGPRVKT